MGVTMVTNEFSSPIALARIFEAFVLDGHNLLPKALPEKIMGVEVHGDGGAGTIKQKKLFQDDSFEFNKYQIDELDKENFKCKYTLIKSVVNGEKIEKVVNTFKVEASPDRGSICKLNSEFHTIGDHTTSEDEIQMHKEMDMVTIKMMECYLIENPDAYS